MNSQTTNNFVLPDVRELSEMAIHKSMLLKIDEANVQKASLNKSKAYEAYLPKVNMEASYTRLNDDLVFPEELQQLLNGAQQLLIKEQTAIATSNLPDAYKVTFSTPYASDPTNSNAPGNTLMKAEQANMKPIPPIQGKNITKANLNAQMLLFSGFKVPMSVKAASHQQNAMLLLSESEKITIIEQVITTYDKMAVVNESMEVLNSTQKYLTEQKKYVDKAFTNGLTIDLSRQKIDLVMQQLVVRRIDLESDRKLLCYRIEELCGYPADSAALLKPSIVPWILADLNGQSSDRPDIKAIDEAIAATDYKRKAEWAEYTPKIVAFGKRELIKDDLTMLDPLWYVGVGMRWTIFDGMEAQNNAQQAKLDKAILEGKKQEAIELSDLNLKRITYEIEKDVKTIETTEKQVKLAEGILNLSKKQYEQGLISLNDQLSSVNDFEKVRLEYIQAIARERAAVSDYLASSGKLSINSIQ
jgi:outer membrane protein TolC